VKNEKFQEIHYRGWVKIGLERCGKGREILRNFEKIGVRDPPLTPSRIDLNAFTATLSPPTTSESLQGLQSL